MTKTEKERDEFIEHLKQLKSYWNGLDVSTEEKLDGLLFSFLVTLDGCSCDMPSYAVIPLNTDKDIKDITKTINDTSLIDIAGCLHDNLYKKR